jgi:hypothetical protein
VRWLRLPARQRGRLVAALQPARRAPAADLAVTLARRLPAPCRSKTQGIALSLGDKLILKQKG